MSSSSSGSQRKRVETYLCKVFLIGSSHGSEKLTRAFVGESPERLTGSTFLRAIHLTRNGTSLTVNLEVVNSLQDRVHPPHFFLGANCLIFFFDRNIRQSFEVIELTLKQLSASLPNFTKALKFLVSTDLSLLATVAPTAQTSTPTRSREPPGATSFSRFKTPSPSSSSSASLSSSSSLSGSLQSLPSSRTPSPSPSTPTSSSASSFLSLFSRSSRFHRGESRDDLNQSRSSPSFSSEPISQRELDVLMTKYRLTSVFDRPELGSDDATHIYTDVANTFLALSARASEPQSSKQGSRGYQGLDMNGVLPDFPTNPLQLFDMFQSFRTTWAMKNRDDLRQDFVKLIEANDLDGLRKMMGNGDNDLTKLVSATGKTLVHSAAALGNTNALRELVGYGLEIDVEDSICRTPLHYAAAHGHMDTCHYLVAHGADSAVPDEKGNTALHLLIRKHGLTLETDSLSGYLRLLMVILRRSPEIVNKCNNKDAAPIHLAAWASAFQTLLLLVNYGHADVGLLTRKGRDLLHCAIERHCEQRIGFGNLKMIRFLLALREWNMAKALAYCESKRSESLLKILREKDNRVRPMLMTQSTSLTDTLSLRIDEYMLSEHPSEQTLLRIPCSLCNPQRPGRLFVTSRFVGFVHEGGDDGPIIFNFEDLGAIDQGRAIAGDDMLTIFVYDMLPHSFVGFLDASETFAQLLSHWRAASTTHAPSDGCHNESRNTAQQFSRELAELSQRQDLDCLGFPRSYFLEQVTNLRSRYSRRETPWPEFNGAVTCEDSIEAEKQLEVEWEESGLLASEDTLRLARIASEARLRTLIERGGIPGKLRADIWFRLSGAAHKRQLAGSDYWERIIAMASQACEEGSERQHYRKQITKDVQRTGVSHPLFTARSDLSNGEKLVLDVLVAYEVRDGRVGYTQSMNVLVKFLLLIFQDAERTFWMLCALLDDYLPGTFGSEESSSLVLLEMDREVLLSLLRGFLPDLVSLHSDEMDWFWVDKFFPTWMMCLFCHESTRLPTPSLLWAWDFILSSGIVAVFEIILTILRIAQGMILVEANATHGVTISDCILHESFSSLGEAGVFRREVLETRRLLGERQIDILKIRREYFSTTFPSKLGSSLGQVARVSRHNTERSTFDWRLDTSTVAPADFLAEVNKFAQVGQERSRPHLDFQSFRQLVVLFSFDQTRSESEVELLITQKLFIIMDTNQDGFIDYFELLVGMLFASFTSATVDAHLDFAFECIALMQDPRGQAEAIDTNHFYRFLSTCYAVAYQSNQYGSKSESRICSSISSFEFKERLRPHRYLMGLFSRRIPQTQPA